MTNSTSPCLCAIDIGNSNIVIGLGQHNAWQTVLRLETDAAKPVSFYTEQLTQAVSKLSPPNKVEGAILCSVVPTLTETLMQAIEQCALIQCKQPLEMTEQLNLPTRIKTLHPDKTGNDIIANSVAAYTRFNTAVIVVDFGTATTVGVTNARGELLGCAIMPGLGTSLNALVSKAAQLDPITLTLPTKVIGADTTSALLAGIVQGQLCAIEGLSRQIQDELGDKAVVIATGGYSSIIAQVQSVFDWHLPELILDGLAVAFKNNI